ncbi:methyltransferase-like protein 2 isoform X2 [Mercurialis annua]|uniref:methyltransferase-like protein 2 isoform X2 n=1 Tax=Mercurialis annua TaxID=3986 RepID=UPI00216094AD|nr:methyltransferase-like protein 2 isoform X2 [Mercurialis annua]
MIIETELTLMEDSSRLSEYWETGIYRFENSKVVFMDPVRVLNRSYTRFRVSPSGYYTRFFDSKPETKLSSTSKKRKRKQEKPYSLNERERAADQRHQQVKPMLLKALECLAVDTDLLATMRDLRTDFCSLKELLPVSDNDEPCFVDLGRVWQAPLYEITLNFPYPRKDSGSSLDQCRDQRIIPVFNNLVVNETCEDVEAELLNMKYLLPRQSCFYMSDLGQIRNLIPAESDYGFNLIVIDPPWENASASQKLLYPTLPNRYFLSLPIKQLTHTNGALVGLWVTNREKLRIFVEKELFPAWGVNYAASFYWLKVKADGSLVSDIDLFHHKPYECLLLGYCHQEGTNVRPNSSLRTVEQDKVIISIPGDYSRKPPIGELLLEHVPGPKPARCLELFAREMMGGWTSWGNEPVHFQNLRYFKER